MSETIVVGTPEPQLLARAEEALAMAQSYQIDSIEMREAAAEDLKNVKGIARAMEAKRKEITGPLDLARGRVMDLFRKPTEFLERAENTLKRACITWDTEQERIRRERAANAARIADAERKRLAEESLKEIAAGNPETGYAIAQAAEMVAPTPVPQEQPKIAGESVREVWSAELRDLRALARAVADGLVSSECILPNMPVLNGQARSLKGTLDIPGVVAVSVRVLATKAANRSDLF